MPWGIFFASKLGRWLASIGFTLLLLGATYWYGGHQREKSIVAKYTAQIAKANAALDKELADSQRELDREFGLRQILRTETRKKFTDALVDYAGKDHGKKDDGTHCSTGISDDGLSILNASIKASAGAGGRKDTGKVPAVK